MPGDAIAVELQAIHETAQWSRALAILVEGQKLRIVETYGLNLVLQLCGQALQWLSALKLLSCAQQFDIISVNSVMVTTARCQLWQETMHLMNAIPQLRLVANVRSVGAAISAVESWKMTLGLMHHPVDTISFCSAMVSCRRAEKWQWTVELLNSMMHQRVIADTLCLRAAFAAKADDHWSKSLHYLADEQYYAIAMASLRRSTAWSSAMQLVEDMTSQRVASHLPRSSPSSLREDAMLLALNAWHHESAWKTVLCNFRSVEQHQIALNLALEACKTAGLWQLALQLNFIAKDAYSYSSLLAVCCESSQWQAATSLLREAINAKLQPSMSATANVVLTSFARQRWSLVLDLHSWLPQQAVTLDQIGHSALLQAEGLSRSWPRLMERLDQMSSRSLVPNCISLNVAMTGSQGGTGWRKALMMERMGASQRIHLDMVFYNGVIGAWAQGLHWPLVLECLKGVQPDAAGLSTSTKCFKETSQWRQALALGRGPHLGTLSSLTSACASAQRWRNALQVSSFPGVSMDGQLLGALIYACQEGSQWSLALAARCQDHLVVPSAVGLNACILACGVGGAWKFAMTFWDSMEGDEFTPTAVIEACGRASQSQVALDLLKNGGEISELTFNAALAACDRAEQAAAKKNGLVSTRVF